MAKLTTILKSPLTLAAKTLLAAEEIGATIVLKLASIALVPGEIKLARSFTDRTSYEEKMAAHKARQERFYYKTLLRSDDAFERFKAAQLHTFGRLGIFDSKYVGKNSAVYFGNKLSVDEQVDKAIKWNRDGALDDQYTLRRIDNALGWMTIDKGDAKAVETSAQNWKKALDWADGKASSSFKNMKEEDQEQFAYDVLSLFRAAPMASGETPGGMVIPPAQYEGTRLYVIFNEKATKTGQHLVATDHNVEPLPQAVTRLEAQTQSSSYYAQRYISEAIPKIRAADQAVLKDLKNYQRKNPSPAL